MTLTKQALLDRAQPRFAWVEIDGVGRVGIRSQSRLRASLRESRYRDPDSGELIPEEIARADLYLLIDQLMASESQPMFTDDDLETLAELDAVALAPFYQAINQFNEQGNGTPKKTNANE